VEAFNKIKQYDMAHKQLNTFHLFAGAGGGILADILLGHNPIGACEIEKYPRNVLLARQRDGILPNFPIWDDVCTLDGKPWRGSVDVLCGGFPCQDIAAGSAMHGTKGIKGERSGLWREYKRLIGEMRPKFVFAENSPLLRTRGLGVVLQDLAELGYDARWGKLGAWHVGAAHRRDRLWVLGYPKQSRLQRLSQRQEGAQRRKAPSGSDSEASICSDGWKRVIYASDCAGDMDDDYLECNGCGGNYSGCECPGPSMDEEYDYQEREGVHYAKKRSNWTTECGVQRVAYGVADRMDRFKAIGNGQVPQCAALAWRILSEGLV
jgi:DNA (cytosine-5)-methyltransferase 1